MAKAMNITDVFKVLLGGGYIVAKCPAVTGKSMYSVIIRNDDRNPGKYVGHLTEKQFEDLIGKNIVVFAGCNTDKYGNISNRYCLEQFLGDEALDIRIENQSNNNRSLFITCGDTRIKVSNIKNYGITQKKVDYAKVYERENSHISGLKAVWKLVNPLERMSRGVYPESAYKWYGRTKRVDKFDSGRVLVYEKGVIKEQSRFRNPYDTILKLEDCLYITTYQNDNFEFLEKDSSFNIYEKCKELDSYFT